MKTLFTFLFAVLLSFVAAAQVNQTSFTESYTCSDGLYLNLQTDGGTLTVYEGNSDEITVEFFVKRRGRIIPMSMKKLKQLSKVVIEQSGNMIDIEVNNKKQRRRKKYEVSMIASVPKSTKLYLKTGGGAIRVKDFDGQQDVLSSQDAVKLSQLSGTIVSQARKSSLVYVGTMGDAPVEQQKKPIRIASN